jgi:hypothetical protein
VGRHPVLPSYLDGKAGTVRYLTVSGRWLRVFFVTSGLTFDLSVLFSSASTVLNQAQAR